jgi:CHAT domain-containing protein/predicted negative regulator of RcsB-dependent stress response
MDAHAQRTLYEELMAQSDEAGINSVLEGRKDEIDDELLEKLIGVGNALGSDGQSERALSFYSLGVLAARAKADPLGEARVHLASGQFYSDHQDLPNAFDRAEQAFRMGREFTKRGLTGRKLPTDSSVRSLYFKLTEGLACLFASKKNWEAASRIWLEGKALIEGAQLFEYWANYHLAIFHYFQKDIAAAATFCLNAAGIFREGRFDSEPNLLLPTKDQICGALYSIGRAAREYQAFDLGEQIFATILSIDSVFGDADFQLGFCQMFGDKYDVAARTWLSIPENHPKYSDALINYAQCLARLGDVESALKALEAGMNRRPQDATPRVLRAGLLADLGRHQEALEDYDIFLASTPKSDPEQILTARKGRILSLHRTGHTDTAIAEAQKLGSSDDPESRSFWLIVLGDLLLDIGQPEEAAKSYEEAQRSGVSNEGIRLRLLNAWMKANRLQMFLKEARVVARRGVNPSAALKLLEDYLQRRPGDVELRKLRAFALLQAVEPDRAESELTKLLDMNSTDAEALHWRGLARLTSRNDPDETGWNDRLTFERVTDAYSDLIEAVRLEPNIDEYRRVFLWLFDRLLLQPCLFWIGLHFCANDLDLLPGFQEAWGHLQVAANLSDANQWNEAIQSLLTAQQGFRALGLEFTAEWLNYRIADNRVRLNQLQLTLDDLDRVDRALAIMVSPLSYFLQDYYKNLASQSLRHRDQPIAGIEFEYRGLYDLLYSFDDRIIVVILRADTLRRIGLHERALAELNSISKHLDQMAKSEYLRQTTYAAVKIYRDAGKLDEALRLIDIIKKCVITDKDRFHLATLEGSILFIQGDTASALEKYSEVSLSEISPEDRFINRLQLAQSHTALRQFEEALTLLDELDVNQAPSVYNRWGYFHCRAMALFELGRLQDALSSTLLGLTILNEQRGQFSLFESRRAWLSEKEKFFEFGVRVAAAANKGNEAFLLAETAKGRTFLDELTVGQASVEDEVQDCLRVLRGLEEVQQNLVRLESSIQRYGADHIDVELVRRLEELSPGISLLEDVPTGGSPTRLSLERIRQERARANNDTARLGTKIEQISLGLSGPEVARLTSYEEVRKILEQEERSLEDSRRIVLVEYFLLAETTLLLVGRSDLSEPKIVLIPFAVPEELRNKFVVALDPRNSDEYQEFDRAMSCLVKPLEAWTQEGDIVLFVRHSVIHYIPLHLLRIDGRVICDRNPITYFLSASLIPYSLEQRRRVGGHSVVYGDPLDDLPFAREEAINVARQLGATARVGDDASKENLLSDLADANYSNVIHLACHGYFDVEDPLESGILLACKPDDGKPSRLTARELNRQKFHASLVVLSACQTGLTVRKGGDELLGLARSILQAGAPSVLLSNWSVDDLATSILMMRFYDLAGYSPGSKKGLLKSVALQQAQAFVRKLTVGRLISFCDETLTVESRLDPGRSFRLRAVRASALALAGEVHAAEEACEALEEEVERNPALGRHVPHSRLARHLIVSLSSGESSVAADPNGHLFANTYYWGGFVLTGDWA